MGTAGPGSDLGLLRSVHSAGVARIALLMGRVRRLPRSSRHGGTPGDRQDDEERGKPSLPVHQFPAQRAIRCTCAAHRAPIRQPICARPPRGRRVELGVAQSRIPLFPKPTNSASLRKGALPSVPSQRPMGKHRSPPFVRCRSAGTRAAVERGFSGSANGRIIRG
jgi:hypothetical protein